MSKYTPDQVARFFGVSIDAVKAQYADNARSLSRMASKATTTKKIHGYSKAQLTALAAESLSKSK